jgi:hypothetical protein
LIFSYLNALLISKGVTKGAKRWRISRGKYLVAGNAVKSLKLHNAEVKQRNIALRNAQMFIGTIKQELRKPSCVAKDVEKSFAIIPVTGIGGSFVRINVRMSRILKLRSVSAHFAKKFLRLIHLRLIFAVPWNVEMLGQKLLVGRCLKNFFGNAFSVARSFGENFLRLISPAESFVRGIVSISLKKLSIQLRPIFTRQLNGKETEKESFFATIQRVNNAGSMEVHFTSIIKNLSEMVDLKVTRILLRFVLIATDFCIVADNLKIVLLTRACSFYGSSPFVVCIKQFNH